MAMNKVTIDPNLLKRHITTVGGDMSYVTSVTNAFAESMKDLNKASMGAPLTSRLEKDAIALQEQAQIMNKATDAIIEQLKGHIVKFEEALA